MQFINSLRDLVAPYFGGTEQPPVQPTVQPEAPVQEEPLPQLDERSPEIVRARRDLSEDQNKELSVQMGLLRVEALAHCENRVREAYNKVKITRAAQNDLNQAYKLLTDSPTDSDNGSITLPENEATRTALHKARGHGISIPENKYVLTKEEKERIFQQLERHLADLDTELKLHFHEVTEATKLNDLYIQTCKSMEDTLKDAKRQISKNMGS